MPRVQKWTCLRGSEWTAFVDAFFMQQRAETRQLNSKLTVFYYNSVLIIMLCIWQSESVINIIVCPAHDECWRDNHRSSLLQWSTFTAAQLNQMHLIRDNNSRPIYTIYKAANIFWNNLYPTWSKKNLVCHSACVNLSQFQFKDWNPCHYAPLSVTDFEKYRGGWMY